MALISEGHMLTEERSLIVWTLPVKQQQRRVQMRTQMDVMFVMRTRISVSSAVMKDSCQSSSVQVSGL